MAHVSLGGLEADMTEARLKAALAKHGKVLSVRFDSAAQTARVAFLDARAAEAFTSDIRRDPALLGRHVTVETTVAGAPTRTEAAVAVALQPLSTAVSASIASTAVSSSSSSSSELSPGQHALAQLRRPGIAMALFKQHLEVHDRITTGSLFQLARILSSKHFLVCPCVGFVSSGVPTAVTGAHHPGLRSA